MFDGKKRIVFVAPLSAISRRLRLLKIANFMHITLPNLAFVHVGWERNEGEGNETKLDFKVEKRIIMRGGGYGGLRVKLYYFLWMIKSFFTCLRFKNTDVIWALGFESAFPALMASKIKGFTVIFDDADRFSLVFSFPRPIAIVIKWFERITSRNVDIHLIPGKERYDFDSNRFHIIKNMPSEIEILKAREKFGSRQWPKSDLVVNINGWLHEHRGLDIAEKLIQETQSTNIHYLVAGRIASKEAEKIIKMNNVTYLGEISNSEALSSYYASDFVLTYFKPNSIINTLAESNKWGDAIKTGTGVIVNREVKTANYLREGRACISFDYDDIENLKQKLVNLAGTPTEIIEFKNNSKKLADKFGYFEDQLRELITKSSR